MKRVALLLPLVLLAAWAQPTGAGEEESLLALVQSLGALCRAHKDGDAKKVSDTIKGFELPDHEAWFKKTFGDENGAKLAKDYGEYKEKHEEKWKNLLADLVEKKATNPGGNKVETPDASGDTGRVTLAISAMKNTVALYTIRFVAGGKEGEYGLASFVYVEKGFRYVGKLKAVSEKFKTNEKSKEVDLSPE